MAAPRRTESPAWADFRRRVAKESLRVAVSGRTANPSFTVEIAAYGFLRSGTSEFFVPRSFASMASPILEDGMTGMEIVFLTMALSAFGILAAVIGFVSWDEKRRQTALGQNWYVEPK
jgi:hypothetical protein